METWDLMPFVRKNWLVIGVTTAVVVLAAMAVTAIVPPVYQSSATLAIQPLTLQEPLSFPSASQLGARSAGELLKNPNVMSRAGRALGASPSSLGATLDFRVAEDNNLVQIIAEAGSPSLAAKVANAVAKAYIDENGAALETAARAARTLSERKLADLRRQLADMQKELGAVRASPGRKARAAELQDRITATQAAQEQILQGLQNLPANQLALATSIQLAAEARPSTSPVRPRPMLNLILSLVGGFFVGLAVAKALEIGRPGAETSHEGNRDRDVNAVTGCTEANHPVEDEPDPELDERESSERDKENSSPE